jgi:hypothetical protein
MPSIAQQFDENSHLDCRRPCRGIPVEANRVCRMRGGGSEVFRSEGQSLVLKVCLKKVLESAVSCPNSGRKKTRRRPSRGPLRALPLDGHRVVREIVNSPV